MWTVCAWMGAGVWIMGVAALVALWRADGEAADDRLAERSRRLYNATNDEHARYRAEAERVQRPRVHREVDEIFAREMTEMTGADNAL